MQALGIGDGLLGTLTTLRCVPIRRNLCAVNRIDSTQRFDCRDAHKL